MIQSPIIYPSITFAIPTFNEAHRITTCLQAIVNQNYPRDLIEILVVDADSTDNTVKIAEQYGAKIIRNPKKLPEPGLAMAYELARGDYMVFLAADNVFFDRDWLSKMVRPFVDDPANIVLSFSKVQNDPKDNMWNKYINEDQEPFSAFVFGNASHPDKFAHQYKTIVSTPDYVIYDYDADVYPLIALAQGTILKTKLSRKATEFDDIAPIIEIIRSGKRIAFIRNTGLYHYSYASLKHIYKKLDFRISNSIKTGSYGEREKNNSHQRRFRKYLFLLYAASIVLPIVDGLRQGIVKRKWYMLLHPIVVYLIAYLIVKNYITILFYEKG